MSEKFPSQLMDRFNVRLPEGMHGDIARVASENGRSMNSEIVRAIEFYLKENNREERMDEIIHRLKDEIISELSDKFNITIK
ncbi:Arc family DNA-binding protein [Providencia rettgeri]|nr:Arc family DNA-binding protein [Providencia rettgeri]